MSWLRLKKKKSTLSKVGHHPQVSLTLPNSDWFSQDNIPEIAKNYELIYSYRPSSCRHFNASYKISFSY